MSVSIRFLDGTFLGPDGRRTRERHLFPAAPRATLGAYALGPAVTAHIAEAEVVTLADGDGCVLGTAAWDGIRPPPETGGGALVGTAEASAAASPVSRPAPIPHSRLPADQAASTTNRTALGRRSGLRFRAVTIACAPLLLAAFYAFAVLSGRVGWELEPPVMSFAGAVGGPVEPANAAIRLRALWFAKPLAKLVSEPFVIGAAPFWIALQQDRDSEGWVLRAAVSGSPEAGQREHLVAALFPLKFGGTALRARITLALSEPTIPLPPADPAPNLVDDAACDQAAGSRLDPDHPRQAGFVDEIFSLSAEAVEKGISACDARTDRQGADRRFAVQRGRLLAARALIHADRGEVSEARRDMDEAVAAWRAGAAHGSALADNLLGAHTAGTFNRPNLAFAQPDDVAAASVWRRGMERGSAAAQRNYAAQLLSGRGVLADPARSLELLNDALARGEERAAGVLGVALYTGSPPGVPRDPAKGWSLIVRAQCADKRSADILSAEIARGAQAPTDRRDCP